jgi:hypothetical protein
MGNTHVRYCLKVNGSRTKGSHPNPDLGVLQPKWSVLQNSPSRIEHQATLQLAGDKRRVGALIVRESNSDALLQNGRKGSTFNRDDQVGRNTTELNYGSQNGKDKID